MQITSELIIKKTDMNSSLSIEKKALEEYDNFKEIIGTNSYPKHMDYINNEHAPNLCKFMRIKIDNKLTRSYYGFLQAAGETVPDFDDNQIRVINLLSSYLPLVRRHDFLIAKHVINGKASKSVIHDLIKKEISGFKDEDFDSAINVLCESDKREFQVFQISNDTIHPTCDITDEFKEFVNDLLDFGLALFKKTCKDEDDFHIYEEYRSGQTLLKICVNPRHNQYGTYYMNSNVYIFVTLIKKDNTKAELRYADMFINSKTLQWESKAHLSEKDKKTQELSKKAYIFVRRKGSVSGLTQPFVFVGTGTLEQKKTDPNANGSFLYDIILNREVPSQIMDELTGK